jgi:REP element-mobilizing transposase RayT
LREELYRYIGGILRSNNGCLHEIGGVEDHIHLLAGIPATIPVADMIRLVKTNSSKWVNENQRLSGRFQWQTGYSAFSVSYSQMERVRRYIQDQEEHHRTHEFKEEFLELLKRHNIQYDMRYVFEQELTG